MPGKPNKGGGGKKTGATEGDDVIFGGKRDDTIDALGGDDFVVGGDGDDTLNGGPGDDELYGGEGDDVLNGGDGDDFLAGNVGADTLNGGADHDIASFTGEPPNAGGTGFIFTAAVGAGNYYTSTDGVTPIDVMTGIEEIWGTNHDDTFIGGDWAETFDGRLGDDVMDGNGGADVLIGNLGNDTLTGGPDADVFVFHRHASFAYDPDSDAWYVSETAGDGNDVITDYEAGDVIRFTTEDPDFTAADVTLLDTGAHVLVLYADDGASILVQNVEPGDLSIEVLLV